MPITRLENPRIYRQIADQLKRLIENNEFPPGSRLPSERDLAQQLQVSRASVREALIALEVIGLVDVKVGNGVIVRSQTPLAPSQEPVMAQAGRNQWAEIDDELNIELDFNAELPPFSAANPSADRTGDRRTGRAPRHRRRAGGHPRCLRAELPR